MQAAHLTEWLNSPETKTLVVYLRRRKAETLQAFLTGELVHPIRQGRLAALHELETLLLSSPDEVKQVFEMALKEQK